MALAVVRHEAVAEHQIGRDRAEQVVIDAELRQVDELEPVALGELARPGGLSRLLGGARLRGGRGVELGVGAAVAVGGAAGFIAGEFNAAEFIDADESMDGVPEFTIEGFPFLMVTNRYYLSVFDRLKSGMYNDRSSPAITMPMMISRIGSISVTNRPRFVSISSS